MNHHASTVSPRLLQALAAIAALILLLVWLEGGFSSKVKPGWLAVDTAPPFAGKTISVRQEMRDEWVSWPGKVTAGTVTQISPRIAARVLRILVQRGDKVESGQLLAELDGSELNARKRQAESLMHAAEAEAHRAKADAGRIQQLYASEAATRQQLDLANQAYNSAQSQAAAAHAALDATTTLLSETRLRAPYAGAIIQRNHDDGDVIMPGDTVLQLQSNQSLGVQTAIPEHCMHAVRLDQKMGIRNLDHQLAGRITEIAPAADPVSQTVTIKLTIDELSPPVQPGSFVWVDLACGQHMAIMVPTTAILHSGQLTHVNVLLNGKKVLRSVRTGMTHAAETEVLSGLDTGETLIMEPLQP